jgi:hypothetical protein
MKTEVRRLTDDKIKTTIFKQYECGLIISRKSARQPKKIKVRKEQQGSVRISFDTLQ